jgi:hypothetical protein
MVALLNKIPQNVHLVTLKNVNSYKSLKLTDLHEYSQSFNEIEQRISNEEERKNVIINIIHTHIDYIL